MKLSQEIARDLKEVMRTFGEIKHVQARIKASPTDGSGRFIAIVSTFGPPPDTQNDIISPGAYLATIMEATVKHPGALWPVFWQHDYEDPESVIGLVIAAAETSGELLIEGQLDLDSKRGLTVYERMLKDEIREWSISYAIKESHEGQWDGEHWARYLDSLELLEISAVVSGANRFTRTLSVKAAVPEPQSELAEINAKLDSLVSDEKPRDPHAARAVDELIQSVREELIHEALDRAEAAAWEERMRINLVLDPVPFRVDARMRPVAS